MFESLLGDPNMDYNEEESVNSMTFDQLLRDDDDDETLQEEEEEDSSTVVNASIEIASSTATAQHDSSYCDLESEEAVVAPSMLLVDAFTTNKDSGDDDCGSLASKHFDSLFDEEEDDDCGHQDDKKINAHVAVSVSSNESVSQINHQVVVQEAPCLLPSTAATATATTGPVQDQVIHPFSHSTNNYNTSSRPVTNNMVFASTQQPSAIGCHSSSSSSDNTFISDSCGFTTPSQPSLQDVIRQALMINKNTCSEGQLVPSISSFRTNNQDDDTTATNENNYNAIAPLEQELFYRALAVSTTLEAAATEAKPDVEVDHHDVDDTAWMSSLMRQAVECVNEEQQRKRHRQSSKHNSSSNSNRTKSNSSSQRGMSCHNCETCATKTSQEQQQEEFQRLQEMNQISKKRQLPSLLQSTLTRMNEENARKKLNRQTRRRRTRTNPSSQPEEQPSFATIRY